MPKISLWKEGAHTNNYKFIDKHVKQQFVMGGTTVNVYKYLGSPTSAESGDATKPVYDTISEQNIQDLLFLENRDRKYDTSVYNLRGHYNVSDLDFDLSQFGLFLQNDTLFISFHLNDMVETLGRKIIAGDVLELPHLIDYFPNNPLLPSILRKYYVVQDAVKSSEGYSYTWFAHLWRCKCTPIVDSQEYADILNQDQGNGTTLKDLISTYNKEIEINDAIITQALAEVPKSGYDTTPLFTVPVDENGKARLYNVTTADNAYILSDSIKFTSDMEDISPKKSGYTGYLLGDITAPNGFPVEHGVSFPEHAKEGDFFLRTDYIPNRMFRFNGKKWTKQHDVKRTSQLPAYSKNQKGTFVNNSNVTTFSDGTTFNERQSLTNALKIQPDD